MSTVTTETDPGPIPPIVARIAGVDVAERVQAAFPAAVHLYNQVAAFAEGEHGQALRDYWKAHDDLQTGNTIDEFMSFDRVSPVLMAIGVPLRSISDFIAEGVGDGLTADEAERIIGRLDGVTP